MQRIIKLLGVAAVGLFVSYVGWRLDGQAAIAQIVLPATARTYFGAVGGGGAPSYNEIALEKNLLYFQ